MKVSENKLVTVEYKLFVKRPDDILEIMERASKYAPFIYLHGSGMAMPKFEELMEGKTANEEFEFTIECKDAHGEYSQENIIDLPFSVFTDEEEIDLEQFFQGAIVPLIDSTGQKINAEIVSINEDSITMDLNHPLAGEDLIFKGRVIDVKEPTEEDLRELLSCNCNGCKCSDNDCEGCQE